MLFMKLSELYIKVFNTDVELLVGVEVFFGGGRCLVIGLFNLL